MLLLNARQCIRRIGCSRGSVASSRVSRGGKRVCSYLRSCVRSRFRDGNVCDTQCKSNIVRWRAKYRTGEWERERRACCARRVPIHPCARSRDDDVSMRIVYPLRGCCAFPPPFPCLPLSSPRHTANPRALVRRNTNYLYCEITLAPSVADARRCIIPRAAMAYKCNLRLMQRALLSLLFLASVPRPRRSHA